MALKKSQIYSSLWKSCDELRGGMDASQYKDYILTLLFVKYVSDKHAGQPHSLLVVPEGGGFDDMAQAKGDPEIGDRINKIIAKLAETNDLKGVIDQADFNDATKLGSGQEMVDRLTKLIGIFQGLSFSTNEAGGDDLLGDAYEYLMRHFATEAGKSKGQFYTPAEVSRVMAKLIGISPDTESSHTVYDPTCGSGSLLIKAANESPNGLSIYGQEIDNSTWSLARMNLILHEHPTAEVWQGNTLSKPHWVPNGQLKRFDFAVSNPPFSQKNWTNGLDPEHDEFNRFHDGIPPAKKGDYAFLLHIVASLKSKGKGAVIMPHGVLFRGNSEATIRRQLVTRGYFKGIIGLPPNLFYGTGIPACIIVIDKENATNRQGIFFVDASKGYIKDGSKNRLREQDIRRITDVFNGQIEQPRYSRMVPLGEIEANDYNLNIPRYIDSSDPEDIHDLDAHLHGGIPQRDVDALQPYWAVFPSLRSALFTDGDRPGYLAAKIDPHELKSAIQANTDFQAYADRVRARFDDWVDAHRLTLHRVAQQDKPGEIIQTLADDILIRFANMPLLDKYDVYQRLMDYADEAIRDDLYLIGADGWVEAAQPRKLTKEKDRKIEETPDLTVNRQKIKTDLIPPALIVARYFPGEQAELERLQEIAEAAAGEVDAFIEEHSGEDGLLAAATTDANKVTKTSVRDRIKALNAENTPEDDEELIALQRCLALFDDKSKADKAVKEAKKNLDRETLAQYQALTEDDIKALVIEEKWMAALRAALDEEVQRIARHLTERIKALEERYAEPLPQIEAEVAALSERVAVHLAHMGLVLD